MAAFSNYLENALINGTLRATTYTAPTTVYVALFLNNPGEDASGTEVSGNAYARQSATFAAPSNGAASTSADVQFPQATGSQGTITHFAIFDALTAGNMLYYGALTASKTIEIGDVFKIATGSLTVTLA
jgi:hypothetical protein